MEPRVGIEPTVAFAAGLQNQSFTIQGIEAFKVWAVMDSNHRSPKRGDLQSPAIAAMRTALKRLVSPSVTPLPNLGYPRSGLCGMEPQAGVASPIGGEIDCGTRNRTWDWSL